MFQYFKIKTISFVPFLQLYPASYMWLVIAGAQMVRKKGRFWFCRTHRLLQQSSHGLSAQAPSVTPIKSLLPFFQFQETQLKADKEWKIIDLVISYRFPFIHLTSFNLQPLARVEVQAGVWILFWVSILMSPDSIQASPSLSEIFFYIYIYIISFNQGRVYSCMLPKSNCLLPSPQRKAPLWHAELL